MPKIERIHQLVLPIALLAGVVVLVFPLPAFIVDGLLALNLSAAIIILVTAVMIRTPLEFSVFPTLLLTTTLARLVLNVATTRLILADADVSGLASAGGIIKGFALFVARDDIIVGGIIFAILVVIQFLVITKGATRISEVAARFALDGMPGRQMAIDADVNAGTIDHAEAQRRRERLSQEADFHGAMDGASKFLRGDAVAGLVVIAINLVGGLALGVGKAGMSVGQAAEVYSKLTIGDGLVSQLPALLISVAAGIVITRSSTRSELGTDMLRQLLAKPQPLLLAATFLLVLTLARFPAVPLVLVGGTLFGLALFPAQLPQASSEGSPQPTATPRRQKRRPDPDPAQSLAIDPLGIEVGLSLVRLADPHRAGTMLKAIADLRHRVARELGLLLPKVRIRDNLSLEESTYRLMMFDAEVARGTCPRRQVFEISETDERTPLAEVPVGRWIAAEEQSRARARGLRVLSPSEYMVEHLRRVVISRAADLLTRDATHRLLEQARPVAGIAIDELVPHRLSLGDVQKVLQELLADGLSIRNLPLIIEALCDESCVDTDVSRLAHVVRQRLRSLTSDAHLSHA